MVMFGKIFGGLILFLVLLSWLEQYIWIPVALVVLWFLIRLGADLFWWGKDEGKW